MVIDTVDFTEEGIRTLANKEKGTNWPVVYILHNKDTAYVGETSNVMGRLTEHYANSERRILDKAEIILDDEFNKSAILDIEQNLIRLFTADNQFKLQNRNAGQSASHDYYERNKYEAKVPLLWEELRSDKLKLAKREYGDLINDEFYKYSPYTSLTEEQMCAYQDILRDYREKLEKDEEGTIVVEGGAGTGKTILALNLLRTFALIKKRGIEDLLIDSDEDSTAVNNLVRSVGEKLPDRKLRVAYCVPMGSLGDTLKKVVKECGLGTGLVLSPSQIAKKHEMKFDVVIVDESHRAKKRKNIMEYGAFDANSEILGLESSECTQLDWIMECSRYRILFYDAGQTVKGSDIGDEMFRETVGDCTRLHLETQMRCKGGRAFTEYVDDILGCNNPRQEGSFKDFEFRLFADVEQMVQFVRIKDENSKLGRVVAGYAWEWKTQNHSLDEIREKDLCDIEIEGHRYIWNSTKNGWILSPNAVNEIGCVHTTQGFDLNYVGVIFGREIDYDPLQNRIVINRDMFFDKKVKNGVDDDTLREYILNTYRVLLTRGIHGCYVYACNENMRKYLERYIGY